MTSLRARCRAQREAIPLPERLCGAKAVCAQIAQSPEYRRARTVLLYHAIGAELSLEDLLRDAQACGKRVLLPRVVSGTLEAAEPRSGLRRGAFGIPEPVGNPVAPDQIDLAVVPMLAFTEDCFRLGWGKGYYDRFLPNLRPGCSRFGAAFSQQLCAEISPAPHDVPLQKIFTPGRVFVRGASV